MAYWPFSCGIMARVYMDAQYVQYYALLLSTRSLSLAFLIQGRCAFKRRAIQHETVHFSVV
jgi:hypothetical protein